MILLEVYDSFSHYFASVVNFLASSFLTFFFLKQAPGHIPVKLINNSLNENTKEITTMKMSGYPVLMSIVFCKFISLFSPHLMISLSSYIKHSKECFSMQISKCLEVG